MKQIVKICIVIGFVIASFILGILIAILGSKECISFPCKTKVTLIKNSMDTSANPCQNFYKFACGNYDTYNSSKPKRIRNMRDEWDRAPVEFTAGILREKPNYTDPFLVLFAKDTFKSCTDEKEIEAKRFGRLITYNFLTTFGFPLVNEDWEREHSLYSIGGIEIQAWFEGFVGGALVDISLENIAGENILMLSIPRVTNLDVPEFKQILQYYSDIYEDIVGKPPVGKILEEIKWITKLKVGITEVKKKYPIGCPPAARLTDTFTYINRDDFGELRELVGMRDKYKYLRIKSMHVQIYFLQYIKDIDKLIEEAVSAYKGSIRVVLNFMIFEYITQLVHLLPKKLRDSYSEHVEDAFDRNDFIRNNRTLYCARLVKDIIPKTLASYYLKTNRKPIKYKMYEKNLIEFIKRGVVKKLKTSKWMTKDDKSKAVKRVNKMRFATPLSHSDIKLLLSDKVDLTVYLRDMCFANSPIEKVILLKKIVINMYKEAGSLYTENVHDIFSSEIFFEKDSNVLPLPLPYLGLPFINQYWPKFLTFSVLGTKIARAIWKALDLDASTDISKEFENFDYFKDDDGVTNYDSYNDDPEATSPIWKKQTLDNYLGIRKCFLKKYNQHLSKYVKKNISRVACISQLSAHALSQQSAFIGYKLYLKTRFYSDASLPKMTYSNDQHFFIDFATYYCKKKIAPYKADMSENTVRQLSNEFQLNQILTGDANFVDAFKCKKGDDMYPDPGKACPVY